MKLKIQIAGAALIALMTGAACQQTANNAAVGNTPNANAASASTSPAAASDVPQTVAADTPAAAYVAAYNARKNKDIVTLRSLMAKDIIEFFQMMGEEDKKSVDDLLRELTERPQAPSAQTKNEKITGDKATLDYLEEDGTWRPMDFVKEGGVWKLTLAVGDPRAEAPGKSNK